MHWRRHTPHTQTAATTWTQTGDLVHKLATVDLREVSAAMLRHSFALQANVSAIWYKALDGVVRARDRPSGLLSPRMTRHERLNAIYGAGQWSDYGP